jgi:hypothetical protein
MWNIFVGKPHFKRPLARQVEMHHRDINYEDVRMVQNRAALSMHEETKKCIQHFHYETS